MFNIFGDYILNCDKSIIYSKKKMVDTSNLEKNIIFSPINLSHFNKSDKNILNKNLDVICVNKCNPISIKDNKNFLFSIIKYLPVNVTENDYFGIYCFDNDIWVNDYGNLSYLKILLSFYRISELDIDDYEEDYELKYFLNIFNFHHNIPICDILHITKIHELTLLCNNNNNLLLNNNIFFSNYLKETSKISPSVILINNDNYHENNLLFFNNYILPKLSFLKDWVKYKYKIINYVTPKIKKYYDHIYDFYIILKNQHFKIFKDVLYSIDNKIHTYLLNQKNIIYNIIDNK